MKYHKIPESSIQAELELDWDFLEHSRTYQLFGIIWSNFSQGLSAFIFVWIFIILAGNKDNHKSLDEFEFLSDPITNYWVSCPWVSEKIDV